MSYNFTITYIGSNSKNFRNTIEKQQKRELMRIEIDTNAIQLKYGSIAEFRREEGISESVFCGLQRKKSLSFKKGSEARKAFNRINLLGFISIIETNQNKGQEV